MFKIKHTLLLIVMFLCLHNAFAENAKLQAFGDTARVYLANATMECTKTYSYEVKAKELVNLGNLQFSINFDPTLLKAENITDLNPAFAPTVINFGSAASGQIGFAWSDFLNPINFPGETVLFTIRFKPFYYGSPNGGVAPVIFTNSPTDIKALSVTTANIPVKTTNAVIKIVDKTKPISMCPSSQFYRGLDSVYVTTIFGNATDDCGTAKITNHTLTGANNKTGLGDANGKFYKLGVTRVTYTATDLAANTSQCVFKIVLVKSTNDSVHIFAGSKLSLCSQPNVPLSFGINIGNANNKNLNKIQFSINWDKNAYDYVGTSNLSSLLSSATFVTNNSANGEIGFIWNGGASTANITDNMKLFSLDLMPKGNAGAYSLKLGGAGTTPMLVTNSSGALPSKFLDGDMYINDENAPTIACKSDTLIYSNVGNPFPLVGTAFKPADADDCGIEKRTFSTTGATTNSNVVFDANTNYNFNLGLNTVTHKASDYAANTATCVQKITVNSLRFATTNEVVPCTVTSKALVITAIDFEALKDNSFTLKWNPAQLTLNPTAITYIDNVIKNNTIVSGSAASGQLTFTWTNPTGSYTLLDGSAYMTLPFTLLPGVVNSPVEILNSVAHQLPTVANPTAPNITPVITNGSIKNFDTTPPSVVNCPNNIVDVITAQGTCTKPIPWTISPIISDNCFPPPSVTLTKQQGTGATSNTFTGDIFPTGVTTVTFKATDAAGNTSACSFTITLTENAPPVITTCIPSITVSTDAGLKTAAVTYGTAVVAESCGLKPEIFSKPTGSNFLVGKSTVIYTATDNSGNTATCTFTVTVNDTEKPVFVAANFPANTTVNTALNTCSATGNWTAPLATDNHTAVNGIVYTTNKMPNDPLSLGINNITYLAKDSTGNIAMQSFTVTVVDNQDPKFVNCPADVTLNATPNLCGVTYAPLTLTTNDNCAGNVTVTTNNAPASNFFGVGTTTLNYTDPNVPSVTCSYKVTVKSVEKPIITCPADVTLNTTTNRCGENLTLPNATATDKCNAGNVTVTNNHPSPYYPVGLTTVTFKATDALGNTSTCNMKVTVIDKSAPVITCPNDITINTEPNKNGATVTWAAPTVVDSCSATNLSGTSFSGTFFTIGQKVVTYTAKDVANNTATCSFTVTVIDNQNPVINCPANNNINVNADPIVCGKTVALPTFTDNSGATPTIVSSNGATPNNFYPVGVTNISLTVKDAAGNQSTCNYTVTVKDVEKPKFAAKPDITVNSDLGTCTGNFPPSAVPVASDACNNTALTITQIPVSNQFPIGLSTVTFTATDPDGNSSSTQVKITVIDKNPPVITGCPADITANAEPNKNGATITWTPPTAKAFCNGNVNLIVTKNPNTLFPVGNTIVVYTATDQNGNSTTCSFNVTVIDTQAPTINCPPGNQILVNADPATCGQIVPMPTFTDNSGKPVTVVTQSGVSANNFYPVGKTNVSITVADDAGNQSTCSFVIIVKDVIKPTFTNVKDVTLNTDFAVCTATLSGNDEPVAQDGCLNTTFTITKIPNLTNYPVGTTTVTYTATDNDGNAGSTTFKVTVQDKTAPVFNTCPTKILTNTDVGKNNAVVTWIKPIATDNCSVNVTESHKPGDVFPIGTTTVKYIATDASGNSVTCTFEVEVKDNEKPKLNCANIVLNNDPGTCGAKITLPTATDNVGVTNTIYNPTLPLGSIFGVGNAQTVNVIVVDAAQNTENCTFTVKVSDNEAPKVSNCPADLTVNAPAGTCKATLNPLPKPTFTDNCDNSSLTITNNRDSLANPFEFAVGDNNRVTFYAKDKSGNVTKCSYNVTVESTLKATIACPSDITLKIGNQKCDTIVNWNPATATAGCIAFVGTPIADVNPNTTFVTGSKTVTYSIKDQKNVETKCSFTVTINETTPPVFAAPFPKDTVMNAGADCTATYNWATPTATDKCDGANTTVTKVAGVSSGDKLTKGIYTVTYRASDKSSNTTDKSFKITVLDKTKPVIVNCPKDVKVNAAGQVLSDPSNHIASATAQPTDCKEVVITFKPITATDNCANLPLITNNGLTKFTLGTPAVYKYTATDADANSAECSFTVTVVPLDAPKAWFGDDKTALSSNPCIDDKVVFKTDSLVGVKYVWTGPNSFTASTFNPSIAKAAASYNGDYTVKTSINGCLSPASSPITLTVATPVVSGKNDDYTTLTGKTLNETVLSNDGIAAGTTVTTKIVKNVQHGTLTLNANGTFNYTSSKDYVGADEFTYIVCSAACPNSCSAEIVAKITVLQDLARIPNVITPNNDGMNDAMIIDYPFTGSEKSELYVFNEWGHEVYRAIPYDNSKAWKGDFKASPVPDGTYFFIFIPDTGKTPQKGFVTLLR